MKVLTTILLFLLVLCLLCGLAASLALVTPIPWLSEQVNGLATTYTWLPLVVAAILIFFGALCVLALALIVTIPGRHRPFVVNRGMGKIEITRRSIESVASAALDDLEAVKRYHVRARGRPGPNRVKLAVEIEPRDTITDLLALGATVQQQLAQQLSTCLEMDPAHIRVRLTSVSPMGREEPERHSKVPRVI